MHDIKVVKKSHKHYLHLLQFTQFWRIWLQTRLRYYAMMNANTENKLALAHQQSKLLKQTMTERNVQNFRKLVKKKNKVQSTSITRVLQVGN